MDLTEFEVLAEPLRRRSDASVAEFGFPLIEGRTATAAEIAHVERDLAVVLPEHYKTFMMRFGGGSFGYLELFPITALPDRYDDLRTINNRESPDGGFLAVAPVGTGDHWGFPVIGGRCQESVWCRFHDDPDDEFAAADFLDFLAEQGLKSPADRALERRLQ